jgi:hypothetical protein
MGAFGGARRTTTPKTVIYEPKFSDGAVSWEIETSSKHGRQGTGDFQCEVGRFCKHETGRAERSEVIHGSVKRERERPGRAILLT